MSLVFSKGQESPPAVAVTVKYDGREFTLGPFKSAFSIGRDPECDVTVPIADVSRTHAEVVFEDGEWWIVDRLSSNGIYYGDARIERRRLEGDDTFHLSKGGPRVRLTVRGERRGPDSGARSLSAAEIEDHYFGDDSSRPAGDHTMIIRRVYKARQAQEKKRSLVVLVAVVAVATVAVVTALIFVYLAEQRRQVAEARLASMLDEIKQLELSIADLRASAGGAEVPGLAGLESHLSQLDSQYEAFITEYGIRRKLKTEEERLIYRVAHVFNESELEIPGAFVSQVRNKINEFWLTPSGKERFIDGVQKAERRGYTPYIVESLRRQGLPPEFFYLAMQESDFDTRAVAWINTRWGWAKGMWQFIPPTAERYDLSVGPLRAERRFDPVDERHNFQKSTDAASQYLSEIYRTLAQASGLLVIASYNWGEHRVASRLEDLPDPAAFRGIERTPQDRSYWRFYREYGDLIPEQTKDYVLKIFSAAVIGMNPRYFGIDIEDPLADYRATAVSL